MIKQILAYSCTILVFSGTIAAAETSTERFCKKDHPGDVANCVHYMDQQYHKLFTEGGAQSAGTTASTENIPYSSAEEARKRALFKPVPGSIIMDSSPAQEIPLK